MDSLGVLCFGLLLRSKQICEHPGFVKVPMLTPLRELLSDSLIPSRLEEVFELLGLLESCNGLIAARGNEALQLRDLGFFLAKLTLKWATLFKRQP